MICSEIFAGCREKALATFACAVGQLLFAGRVSEIGGWAADVVDISLKVLVIFEGLGFSDKGVVTS